MKLVLMILIGALAGWIAEKVLKRDDSFLINILAGVAGSMIGGSLFRFLGLNMNGFIGSLITATIGAILLLWIIARIRSRS